MRPIFFRKFLSVAPEFHPTMGFHSPAKFHLETKWALSLPKPCKGERNEIGVTHSQGNGSHAGLTQKRGVTAPLQAGYFHWLLKNLTNFSFPKEP